MGAHFRQAGYPEVSPAFGSILLPLFEEDGLRMTDLGQRAGLSQQTMTTMIRLMEERGLVERRPDPLDRRAARIFLTERSQAFKKVAGQALEVMDTLVKSQIGPDQIDSARDVLKVIARLGRH